MSTTRPCVCCGQLRQVRARRLCPRCYYGAGVRADFPPLIRSGEELMADYRLLRGEGHTDRQIAERMGIKLTTLRRAVLRARARERLLDGVLAR